VTGIVPVFGVVTPLGVGIRWVTSVHGWKLGSSGKSWKVHLTVSLIMVNGNVI